MKHILHSITGIISHHCVNFLKQIRCKNELWVSNWLISDVTKAPAPANQLDSGEGNHYSIMFSFLYKYIFCRSGKRGTREILLCLPLPFFME